MQKQSFILGNAHCSACEAKITKALSALPAVQEVSIDLESKSMQVTFNDEALGVAAIVSHVQQAGFSATPTRYIHKQEDISLEGHGEAPSPPMEELATHSNAHETKHSSHDDVKTLQEQSFMLNKVHCASCQSKIHAAVMQLEGVEKVYVDTLRKSVVVTFDSEKMSIESIENHFVNTKYAMKPVDKSAFMPLIPHISTVKQRKIPQIKEEKPASIQNNASGDRAQDSYQEAQASGNIGENMAVDAATVGAQWETIPKDITLSNITLIEPPKEQEQAALTKQNEKKNKLQKQEFNIGNVHCTSCEAKVIKLLSALDGIEKVNVNILRKSMLVSFDGAKIQVGDIVQSMEKAGYTATAFKGIMDHISGKNTPPPTLRQEHNIGLTPISSAVPVAPAGEGDPSLPVQASSNVKGGKEAVVSDNEQQNFEQEDLEQEELATPSFWSNWPLSLILSLTFASILMYVAMAPMLNIALPNFLTMQSAPLNWALAQALLTLPILLINRRIFISGFRGIITASPNMDSLVGLGSATAALFGTYALWRIFAAQKIGDVASIDHFVGNLYFDSAGMILALIGLGKFFENKARERTGSAIDALMRLTPPTAIVLRDGEEVSIASHDVQEGDILVVYAGQSLAADGIITQGEAFIDTSAITGESLPQEKRVGDSVIGATICQSGYFHMQVTGSGEHSVLAQIIELVETATASKAPIAKLADRISAIFVPIIIGIAVLSFASWMLLGSGLEFALSTAISVLVISCPCALGLATPTAIMVGMGMGAERGILFKSAATIERMQNIDTVVLDKTGTLTHGKPVVTDIITLGSNFVHENTQQAKLSDEQKVLLSTAASLEKFSEHPLGQAIVHKAQEYDLELIPSDKFINFTQMPGLGISAMQDETPLLAGNARLLAKENILNPLHDKEKELARLGKTVLYFVRDKSLLGLIAVADTVKETSRSAVRDLKTLGLNVFMLTGDNALTAKAVQDQVDIENIFAEVLPQEKEEKIRELQEAGHKVIMVGDGINDAPALARAHVGIAIGKGTDIALQSSDVVLMQSDVAHVSGALKLSMAVMRTIKQNLFWAFAYNALLIPVAAGLFYGLLGLTLNPMLAAASMSLSSLTVVGNALRLRLQAPKIF